MNLSGFIIVVTYIYTTQPLVHRLMRNLDCKNVKNDINLEVTKTSIEEVLIYIEGSIHELLLDTMLVLGRSSSTSGIFKGVLKCDMKLISF